MTSTTTPSEAGLIALRPALRVIADNDYAGDPDGLWALAHLLLSPTVHTVAITSSLLDPGLAAAAGLRAGHTAALGQASAHELLAAAGLAGQVPVLAGAEGPGAGHDAGNAAAQAIVQEALREDPLPLCVACGGPLTNVAAALRLAPAIAQRLTLVWVGGTLAGEGADEYNFATDAAAAREVLACPGLRVHQVPREAYRTLRVSVAELGAAVRPISALSRWLYARYLALPPFVQLGGSLTLGDSALVLLCALGEGLAEPLPVDPPDHHAPSEPARLPRQLRTTLDARLLLADLVARLTWQAQCLPTPPTP